MISEAGERREARRYPVSVTVELPGGRARTRDASESGIYFETDQSLSAGPIRFWLVLGRVDPESRIRVECEGQVVRVEPRGSTTGIAAQIQTYRLEREPVSRGLAGSNGRR